MNQPDSRRTKGHTEYRTANAFLMQRIVETLRKGCDDTRKVDVTEGNPCGTGEPAPP